MFRWVRAKTEAERAAEAQASEPARPSASAARLRETPPPKEVDALLEQLDLAYEQESRMLRGIGHDFKSPLASILRSSEALAAGEFGPMGPEQAEVARLIAESARHLMAIAQALYAVGGAREEDFHFGGAEVDLAETTARVVEAHRSSANAQGVELTLVVPDDAPLPVCAGQGVVERILGNVLNNAVKFTSEGCVLVTVGSSDTHVTVTVADTGIGIPPAELDAIGTEFVRATNAGEISGSGVGLAIVRYLLAGMGGSFGIESVLGEGTRVTVAMPISQAESVEQ